MRVHSRDPRLAKADLTCKITKWPGLRVAARLVQPGGCKSWAPTSRRLEPPSGQRTEGRRSFARGAAFLVLGKSPRFSIS